MNYPQENRPKEPGLQCLDTGCQHHGTEFSTNSKGSDREHMFCPERHSECKVHGRPLGLRKKTVDYN